MDSSFVDFFSIIGSICHAVTLASGHCSGSDPPKPLGSAAVVVGRETSLGPT